MPKPSAPKPPEKMSKAELLAALRETTGQLSDCRTGARFLAGIAARGTENAGSTLRVALKLDPDDSTPREISDVRMHCRAMWDMAEGNRRYINDACSLAGIDRPEYDDRPADEVL